MDSRFALIAALLWPARAFAIEGQVGLTVGVTTAKEKRLLGNVYIGLDGTLGLDRSPRGLVQGSHRFQWQGGPQAEARISLLGRPSIAVGAFGRREFVSCDRPDIGAQAELGFVLEQSHSGVRIGAVGFGYLHQTRISTTVGAGVPQVAFAVGNTLGMGRAPCAPRAIDGRPVRDEAGSIVLPCNTGTDVDWLTTAQDEHAAVASFVVLAQQLTALGAPRSLIGAVWRAAAEEVGHALEAYRRAGTAVIHPIPLPHRPILDRASTLRRIAHEALHDGIINEGNALLGVLAQRDGAREDALARHLDDVAHEEAGHIAVNAQVHRWALRELGLAA